MIRVQLFKKQKKDNKKVILIKLINNYKYLHMNNL